MQVKPFRADFLSVESDGGTLVYFGSFRFFGGKNLREKDNRKNPSPAWGEKRQSKRGEETRTHLGLPAGVRVAGAFVPVVGVVPVAGFFAPVAGFVPVGFFVPVVGFVPVPVAGFAPPAGVFPGVAPAGLAAGLGRAAGRGAGFGFFKSFFSSRLTVRWSRFSSDFFFLNARVR